MPSIQVQPKDESSYKSADGLGVSVSCVADEDKNMSSVQRCLADSLVLLAQQEVGSEKLWLLPQAQWQKGETLRQTAERALASLSGNNKER